MGKFSIVPIRAILFGALFASVLSFIAEAFIIDYRIPFARGSIFLSLVICINGYSLFLSMNDNEPPEWFRHFFVDYDSYYTFIFFMLVIVFGYASFELVFYILS